MLTRSLSLALSLTLLGTLPAFAGDKDNDRIPDKIDACPTQAEDKDLYQDNDGCPDPDDDSDKVCDPIISQTDRLAEFASVCTGVDKCPNQPEDIDGFEDEDGCPDLDNDKDGIADKFDKCPMVPEDMDGFEDADGCPDLDNDSDAVVDASDKCPMAAEDKDGFEDEDGCPDLDNDKDGIPDLKDKCPNEAEVVNGVEDADGCPDVAEKPLDPVMLLPVGFETGTSTIDYNGKIALDDIAIRLVAWSKVTVGIRVWEGRKVRQVKSKKYAIEDSTLRVTTEAKANAIAKYLAEKGVALERIQVKGEGPWDAADDKEKTLAKPGAHKVQLEVISGLEPKPAAEGAANP